MALFGTSHNTCSFIICLAVLAKWYKTVYNAYMRNIYGFGIYKSNCNFIIIMCPRSLVLLCGKYKKEKPFLAVVPIPLVGQRAKG